MPTTGSKVRNLGAQFNNPLAKALMYLLAVLIMVPYEAASALSNKSYKGFLGILRFVFLGLPLGVAGGIAASHYVGWTLGFHFFLWMLAGLAGFVGVTFFAFPILHLAVLSPAWNLAEAVWKAIREFAKSNFEMLTAGFIRQLGKVFPFSSIVWNTVLKRTRPSWVDGLLTVLTCLCTLFGSWNLGFNTYAALNSYLTTSWGVPALTAQASSIFVGFLTGVVAVGVLMDLLKYGKISFIAMATGAVAVFALVPKTTAFVTGPMGLASGFTYAAYLLEYVFYTAYLFPAVNVALTDGFRWFVETVKPLIEKVYEGEEKNYRQFFHSLVNIAAAGMVFAFSMNLTFMLTVLPGWAPYLISGFAALLSYILVFKALDFDGGNAVIGVILSAASGILTGAAYSNYSLMFGNYGAIGVGISTSVLTFCLVFPLLYILVRALTNRWIASWASQPLVAAHTFMWEGFKKFIKELSHAYDSSYKDKSSYHELFLHLVNLATTVAAAFGGIELSHSLGFAIWSTVGCAITFALASYLLVGKFLLKSGLEFIGILTGIAGGIWSGAVVYAAANPRWAAGLAGLAVGASTFFLAFPIAYVVLRAITNPLLTGWLLPILVATHNWCWARFVDLWELFVSIYRAIRNFIKPYWLRFLAALARAWQVIRKAWIAFWGAIVGIWTPIWQSIKEAWASLRGRNRNS